MPRRRTLVRTLSVMTVRVEKTDQVIIRDVVRRLRKGGGAEAVRAALDAQPLGLFRDEESALKFVSGAIMSAVSPQSAWLFVSRARRDHRSDSDIDVLVVMPDSPDFDDHDVWKRAHKLLVPGGLAIDMLVCTVSEFETDYLPGSIIEQIRKGDGRRLFADKKTTLAERAASRER
jgi:predicted nucleotidyltransferase